MQEDYIIKVVTKQRMDGESEQLEITTTASFEGEDDNYYICYTDEDDDMKECKTTLHVENGRYITINREGSTASHIVLERDKRHVSHHETPYGAFSMGICASDVRSTIKKNGGTLYFKYTTDVDMMPVGNIEFDITLLKKDRNNKSAISEN